MQEQQTHYQVGTDVGGTFTDVVAHDAESGRIISFKVPSNSRAPAEGVTEGLRAVLPAGVDISAMIHGTTIATNAILEGRGARTALITTRGFRDVLEIARQSRENLYDLSEESRPEPIVPRNLRLEITERVTYKGEVLDPLHVQEIPRLIDAIKSGAVEAAAVCLLHSYAYPSHERALKAELTKVLPHVSISSDINAEYREYERTNTVVLNAYLMPLVSQYLDRLLHQMSGAVAPEQVQVMRSNGGMMSVAAARETPLATVMSGPAGGVAGSRYLVHKLGIRNAVTFDMGGTSTDVCLTTAGEATVTNQRRIGGQTFRMPTVAVESIGAGGGSIAWIDEAGALKVGPQSAGAEPGPACYGLGGTAPTVTDANLVLGYLDEEAVLGGSIRIDRRRSEEALLRLASAYSCRLREMAEGIVEVANSNMMRALRSVSVQRGFDLRDFTLVAFGGAGPIHAGRLARQLNIPRVIVPAFSGVFSAFGCLVSDLRYDAVQTKLGRLDAMTSEELEAAFDKIIAQQEERLRGYGYPVDEIAWMRSLDLRYMGQKYELEVALPQGRDGFDLAQVRKDFDRLHEMAYSYSTDEDAECVNLRLSAVVPSRHPELPLLHPCQAGEAMTGRRRAYFSETGKVTAGVYFRGRLEAGRRLTGPAIVEDEWSTTVIYPGQVMTVDQYGNLILETVE